MGKNTAQFTTLWAPNRRPQVPQVAQVAQVAQVPRNRPGVGFHLLPSWPAASAAPKSVAPRARRSSATRRTPTAALEEMLGGRSW